MSHHFISCMLVVGLVSLAVVGCALSDETASESTTTVALTTTTAEPVPDFGSVTVHTADAATGPDSWIGMVVECTGGPTDDCVMVREPTGPVDLKPGDGTGMYNKGSIYIMEVWGQCCQRPPELPELLSMVDSPSHEGMTKEVLWLAWLTGDTEASPLEIKAAIEHDVTKGFRLHPECHVSDTLEYAVALTDKDLVPVEAWAVGPNYTTFEEVDPNTVACEASITEWLYEDES